MKEVRSHSYRLEEGDLPGGKLSTTRPELLMKCMYVKIASLSVSPAQSQHSLGQQDTCLQTGMGETHVSTQSEQRLPSALRAVHRPMSRAKPIGMIDSAQLGRRASALVNG